MKRWISAAAWLLGVAVVLGAPAHAETKRPGHNAGNAAGTPHLGAGARPAGDAGPELPGENDAWAHRTVFVILGLFVAAWVIGPVVRDEVPEEVPSATSHDEPLPAHHHHDGTAESSHVGPSHGHGEHGHGGGGHH